MLAARPAAAGRGGERARASSATLRVTAAQAVYLAAAQSFARDVRLLARAPGRPPQGRRARRRRRPDDGVTTRAGVILGCRRWSSRTPTALVARARALAAAGRAAHPRHRRAARGREVDRRARRSSPSSASTRGSCRWTGSISRRPSSCGSGGATGWARRTRSTPPATPRCCAACAATSPSSTRPSSGARSRSRSRARSRCRSSVAAGRHRGQLPAARRRRWARSGRCSTRPGTSRPTRSCACSG